VKIQNTAAYNQTTAPSSTLKSSQFVHKISTQKMIATSLTAAYGKQLMPNVLAVNNHHNAVCAQNINPENC
jgi:hypothetical protein